MPQKSTPTIRPPLFEVGSFGDTLRHCFVPHDDLSFDALLRAIDAADGDSPRPCSAGMKEPSAS